ncbi:hypothetical protein Dimus_022984 [Dionaea muscipula]
MICDELSGLKRQRLWGQISIWDGWRKGSTIKVWCQMMIIISFALRSLEQSNPAVKTIDMWYFSACCDEARRIDRTFLQSFLPRKLRSGCLPSLVGDISLETRSPSVTPGVARLEASPKAVIRPLWPNAMLIFALRRSMRSGVP